jgi:hypothetical protein
LNSKLEEPLKSNSLHFGIFFKASLSNNFSCYFAFYLIIRIIFHVVQIIGTFGIPLPTKDLARHLGQSANNALQLQSVAATPLKCRFGEVISRVIQLQHVSGVLKMIA